MAGLWAKQSIASLLSRAKETEAQAILAHDGVPLKRTLTAPSLVALGIGVMFTMTVYLVQRGVINAAELVTHRFPLAQITEAFATAQKPESLKVLVTFAS